MRHLLVDLDETLYPKEAGILLAIRDKIREFISSELDMDPEQAESLRLQYLEKYGTSMRGLIVHHEIDPEDYLAHVHRIDIEGRIKPAGGLRSFLGKVDARKVIFTNATVEHAHRVLDALRVKDQFDRVIDIRDVGFVGKPEEAAYRKALEILDFSMLRSSYPELQGGGTEKIIIAAGKGNDINISINGRIIHATHTDNKLL